MLSITSPENGQWRLGSFYALNSHLLFPAGGRSYAYSNERNRGLIKDWVELVYAKIFDRAMTKTCHTLFEFQLCIHVCKHVYIHSFSS